MNKENKRGFRWAIFRYFGPPEVKNLINYIDELHEVNGTEDIAIFPVGEYPLNIGMSSGEDVEPMIFQTMPQLLSFQAGLSYGVSMLGGSVQGLSQEDYEAHQEMNNRATHSGGGGRKN